MRLNFCNGSIETKRVYTFGRRKGKAEIPADICEDYRRLIPAVE
jgi:hypothetical protein